MSLSACLDGGRDTIDASAEDAMLAVTVAAEFMGTVVLEADCRDETYHLEPGDELRIERAHDDETCSYDLRIDDDTVRRETVDATEAVTLRVTGSGSIAGATAPA
ncbi:hypothetical protein [Natrarchaeobaculum sulfurireducens]|nr:hypothetical protein [Natrarchaeobaculum sulfurireducens]